jgi:hypothetical protein
MQWYLESTKAQGLRFKILEFDRSTRRAKLLGVTGVPFERVLSDDVLEKFGYRVMQGEPEAQEHRDA